ncbi:deoxyguanosinetriphosphate triphosphohydrolase [Fusibacter bizertensis]
MDWSKLLTEERIRPNKSMYVNEIRSEFQKDYHRIIESSAFRRLQDKTQVFPLEKSDFIRTRLTHSLEVSSIAKSLGQIVTKKLVKYRKIDDCPEGFEMNVIDILQCAGLLHDIGNPPFGHFGETVIQDWFEKNLSKYEYKEKPLIEYFDKQMIKDLYNFEGNAQALRIITKLHNLVDTNGMNLTKALLCTLIKYPSSSVEIRKNRSVKHKKMGYFYAEKETFHDIVTSTGTEYNRHPLTFLLEAADDIAYLTADIEDAAKKGLIDSHTIKLELKKILDEEKSAIDNGHLSEEEVNGKTKYLKEALDDLIAKEAKASQKPNPGFSAVQNWIIKVQGLLINSATYSFDVNYAEIMNGSYNYDLFFGTFGEGLVEALKKIAYEYIFCDRSIQKIEIAAEKIIGTLLDLFIPAVIYYDTEVKLSALDKKVVNLISESHTHVYRETSVNSSESEKLYLRLLMVTDFISGMTDSYAKELYNELNGIK